MSLPIYAGHSAEYLTPSEADYLGIVAVLPRQDNARLGIYEIPVTFQIFTSVGDPGNRTAQAAAHADRMAAIIDLFDDNNFHVVLSALNDRSGLFGDQRPWKGLGFTGWEPDNQPDDTRDETRYIATLPYTFDVFKEDDINIASSIQYALEKALKSYITTRAIL
jgi:hypothetical protein